MSDAILSDPILGRLKAELTKLYGSRLKQVLLYGSRARGDHREDSDYDVMVVLEPPLDYWDEIHRLSELSSQLLWDTIRTEHPVDVSFKPVTAEKVQARTGFMHNVRAEAVELLSPESTDYMGVAEWSLEQAHIVLRAGAFEIAAREAYSAALNAARAIIFEKTGRATKTHSGVRTQLHKLIYEGLAFDIELAKFLPDAFEVKLGVDYGPVEKLSRHEAEDYVRRATEFLAAAKAVIEGG